MPEPGALARGPVQPAEPVAVVSGWEVSVRRSVAALRLADESPLAKLLVRAEPAGLVAARLAVTFGRAARDEHRTLVVGSGVGEWLLLAAAGAASTVAERLDTSGGGLVSVIDVTHGRALLRLSGERAADVLGKVCAIDLSEAVTPHGRALRSSVAEVTTDIVRDDVGTVRSYLLHCERASSQYLFDALLDAGREFGVDRDGFHPV